VLSLSELRLGSFVLRTPAVCGAVMGRDVREMGRAVARARKMGADLVELRADTLEEVQGWHRLVKGDFPIIFTNRPRREGGEFRGGERERVEILQEAIERHVACVDVEFSTPAGLRKRVISAAKREGVSVLVSWHDFSKTPAVVALKARAKKMAAAGGDLVKLVTFANSVVDSIRVLDFLVEVQEEISVPAVAFAMGEAGRMTRIASLLLGSPFTYASVGRMTAPGQFDVAETRRLLSRLMPREG